MFRLLSPLSILAITTLAFGSPTKKLDTETENRLRALYNIVKANNVDAAEYLLSGDVLPITYALSINLPQGWIDEKKFTGQVEIELKIQNETTQIQLHYKELTILSAKLMNHDKGTAEDLNTDEYIEETQILHLNTSERLNTDGSYSLTIDYEGSLSDSTMNGFYISSYKNGNNSEYLATTHFESTNARKAFPCFDEPEMKAQFALTLTFPNDYEALSNTKEVLRVNVDDFKQITFKTTPKMSTYLLAFIVSKFERTESTETDNNQLGTAVYSRTGTQTSAELAANTGTQVLEKMKAYTGYSYTDSGMDKLDQVAIPDFAAGAMENWGLVTYREAYLLWDKSESSASYQERVVTAIAHELSHQWFGDLITLHWWSDLFLNEGFATYFEYHIADELYPEWQLRQQFVVDEVQTALLADSYPSSSALSSDATTPTEISNKFDDISYNKGGSVLRMVQHFVGLDLFKQSLTQYVSTNNLQNSDPTALWSAFDDVKINSSNVKMTSIMNEWTINAGYPVLSVSTNEKTLIISQKRFYLTEPDDAANTKWYVPITYTLSTDEASNATTPLAWLTPTEDLVLEDFLNDVDWVILNKQQSGFYRVDYDEDLWKKIITALENADLETTTIDEISRSQIVDDLLNFARSGQKNYGQVLPMLKFLENETSYYTWTSAFNGFSYLLERTATEAVQKALNEFIIKLVGVVYASTPIETEHADDHIYTFKQAAVLSWVCKLGDQTCIDKINAAFTDFRNNTIKPSSNLQSVIYCNALRYSSNIRTDFEFLWEEMVSSQISSEQVIILKALGCVKDADTLKLFMSRIIAVGSAVRIQDTNYAFTAILSSNPENVNTGLDFVTSNYSQFITHFGDATMVNSLLFSIANRFTTQAQIDKLQDFYNNNDLDATVKEHGAVYIETAKNNLKVTTSLEKQLKEYFQLKESDSSSANAAHLPITLFALIYFIVVF